MAAGCCCSCCAFANHKQHSLTATIPEMLQAKPIDKCLILPEDQQQQQAKEKKADATFKVPKFRKLRKYQYNIYLSIYLSISISLSLSIYLSIYLSINMWLDIMPSKKCNFIKFAQKCRQISISQNLTPKWCYFMKFAPFSRKFDAQYLTPF